MKVLRIAPEKPVEVAEVENTLEALQAEVGGHIETVTISSKICAICNEVGLRLGLPYNGMIFGTEYVGTVLLVGTAGEEFRGLTEREIDVLRRFVEDEEP